MKRNKIFVILTMSTVLSICSCQRKEPEKISIDFDTSVKSTQGTEIFEEKDFLKESETFEREIDSSEETIPSKETMLLEETNTSTETKELSENFTFADLKKYKFWFLSGAGAWATVLHINPDGSFSGEYYDSDMGVTGEEYPNGTMYKSNFSGQFTQPTQVNEYTYVMQIAQINYAHEIKTEEIKDGVKYCYTYAYGLENAKDILIYLPGAPLDKLPEGFRSWVGYYDLSTTTETVLPFYALNNETQQEGFYAQDVVEAFQKTITYAEEWAAELEASITNDPLTTVEYNEKTNTLFRVWDNALNDLWEALQYTQDEEKMAALTIEEREWITWKEQEIQKAGAAYEGGSIRTMIVNQKAAELTKDRVYELMKWIS
ncbi:MAG: DUF1311 domain-containing protein [Lachnospiraceae bacterium]|jgi:Uncharacterized protein conserved in bacteria